MLPEASLKEVAETNISFSNIEYLSELSLYNIKTDNKTSIMLLKYLPYWPDHIIIPSIQIPIAQVLVKCSYLVLKFLAAIEYVKDFGPISIGICIAVNEKVQCGRTFLNSFSWE